MNIQSLRNTLKRHFFLDVDPAADTVAIPRLMVNRTRCLLWLSLGVNGLLLAAMMSLLSQNSLDRQVVSQSANMAKTTQHLSELYGLQVEDLASAYTHYGQALQATAPATRQQHLAKYHAKIQQFNNRSYELTKVSQVIRDQAQKIARLFRAKERA